VGYDSNRVIDHTTNDKIGILSHEGTSAADRPCQGDCVRQSRKRPDTFPGCQKVGGPFRDGRWWFPELRFSLLYARPYPVKSWS